MKLQGQALTRPELAVLTAYAKLELFDEIVASAAPDDAFFGWVVGLGPSAEILAPESAKRRMCALIEGVQARYLGA